MTMRMFALVVAMVTLTAIASGDRLAIADDGSADDGTDGSDGSAGSGSADPTAAQVLALFTRGRDALAAQRAAEACDDFTAALTLDPEAAGIMLNLGLCNRELDKLATALRWFRKAQARGSENGLAEIEAAAKQEATDIAARVATVNFTLAATAPATVTKPAITLDGAPITAVDVARVELDAGHHVVEVTTDAGTSHREVSVADGEAASIELAVPHRERRVSEVDRGAVRRHRALVLGETSAVVLGATLIGGVVAHHVAADPATGVDTEARLQSGFRWGVTPIATAAIAGVAIAGYLYATAPRAERREQIVPVVDAGHVGLSLTTHF
jgi:hypothetical protein